MKRADTTNARQCRIAGGICLIFTILMTTACVEENLMDRTDGTVRIVYEWDDNLPRPTNGMQLYFYPSSGEAPLVTTTSTDGYETKLPHGEYSLLAFNTAVSGLKVENTRSSGEASVEAIITSSGGELYVQPEGREYSVWDASLVVMPRRGVQEMRYKVRPLNAPIPIHVVNQTGQILTEVSGELEGVVLSRQLSTGNGNFAEGYGNIGFSVNFDNGAYEATNQVLCLGLYNPAPEQNGTFRYRSKLDLHITYANGTVTTVGKDISQQLAQQMDTADLSNNLRIEVILAPEPIDIIIQVTDWNDGGSQQWSGW
ncbi:MAG: DUF5119 domain-containing protein [Mediterranea sp.]|nr:DUF5119 domain-containing protein [Mediterranea sp.]